MKHLKDYYNLVLDEPKMKTAIAKLKEKNLARLEIFQLLNARPQKLVELVTVVCLLF